MTRDLIPRYGRSTEFGSKKFGYALCVSARSLAMRYGPVAQNLVERSEEEC
jgi:hypothetical protein